MTKKYVTLGFPQITQIPLEARLQLLRQFQKLPWILNVKLPHKGFLILKLSDEGKSWVTNQRCHQTRFCRSQNKLVNSC